MVVHAGRPLGRPRDPCDLLVCASLYYTQKKDFPLCGRQALDRCAQPTLRFAGHEVVQRGMLARRVEAFGRVDLVFRAPSASTPPIEYQPPRDREQPRAQRTLGAKAVECLERAHERVLHDLLSFGPHANAGHVARQRRSVPFDEGGCGTLVAAAPAGEERIVERIVGVVVDQGGGTHGKHTRAVDAGGAPMLSWRTFDHPRRPSQRMPVVELIAHRGAPRERRENTLASFARALAHDADGLELDVHFSADGVPVVHHDAVFGDVSGAHAGVALCTLTAATITTIEVAPGERVPTLRDVASLVGARATLYVEVKAVATDDDLCAVVDALAGPLDGRRPRFALHAFDHRIARRAADIAPGIPTGILSESYLVDTTVALRAARARDLWQHWSQVDAPLVREIHDAGGRVIAWTVNDGERARRLATMGVDALCTDDVPLIRAALAG